MSHFFDSHFAKAYRWASKAKFTMGIFFVAFVFVYFILGFAVDGAGISLAPLTALQMVCTCFLIGVMKQFIIQANQFTKLRCSIWVFVSVGITIVSVWGFGWFRPFPIWCPIVFVLVMAIGMGAMILSHYLDLNRETKQLNQQLAKYQKQSVKIEPEAHHENHHF